MFGTILYARGRTGELTFDGTAVVIRRQKAGARISVGKGEKTIPVGSITSVQWKEPGALVNGYIEFTVPGGNEARAGFGTQTVSAVNNENAIIITKAQAEEFRLIKAAVERAILHRHQPAPPPAPARANSAATELSMLADLLAKGLLTEAEFAEQKRRILGGSW